MPLQDRDAITLVTEDLAASRAFYAAVVDRPVVHEDNVATAFDLGNVVVNLLQASEAVDPVAPGEVAPPSGHRFLLTVGVEDVYATCATPAELGVALEPRLPWLPAHRAPVCRARVRCSLGLRSLRPPSSRSSR